MKEGEERKIVELEDIPYTVIAKTLLPEEFSCFLTGSGLRAILKEMRDGEDLRITFRNGEPTQFEIVDTHNKYYGKK